MDDEERSTMWEGDPNPAHSGDLDHDVAMDAGHKPVLPRAAGDDQHRESSSSRTATDDHEQRGVDRTFDDDGDANMEDATATVPDSDPTSPQHTIPGPSQSLGMLEMSDLEGEMRAHTEPPPLQRSSSTTIQPEDHHGDGTATQEEEKEKELRKKTPPPSWIYDTEPTLLSDLSADDIETEDWMRCTLRAGARDPQRPTRSTSQKRSEEADVHRSGSGRPQRRRRSTRTSTTASTRVVEDSQPSRRSSRQQDRRKKSLSVSSSQTTTTRRKYDLGVYQSERILSEESESDDSPIEVASARKAPSDPNLATVSVPATPTKQLLKEKYGSDEDILPQFSQETKPFARSRRKSKVPVKEKEKGKDRDKGKGRLYVEDDDDDDHHHRGQQADTRRRSLRSRKSASKQSDAESEDDMDDDLAMFADMEKLSRRRGEPPRESIVASHKPGDGAQLSAAEIIAQLRARTMAELGITEEDDEDHLKAAAKDKTEGSTSKDANTRVPREDSSDEELADADALIQSALNYQPKPQAAEKVASPVEELPTFILPDLPKDRSKFGLDSLIRKKAAAERRGWFGVDAAMGTGINEERDSSDEGEGGNVSKHGRRGDHEGDDDSDGSLPDVSRSSAKKANGEETKGESKRLSPSAMEKVAGVLKSESSAFEAIRLAQETIETEARLRGHEAALEHRRFWYPWDSLKIEPFQPYDPTGCTGIDRVVRQAIVDGLENPRKFPADLFSSFSYTPRSLNAILPSTYPLYQLIAHPTTPSLLADKALRVLVGYLKRPIQSADIEVDTDVELNNAFQSLLRMGAKSSHIPRDVLDEINLQSDTGKPPSSTSAVEFTSRERMAATLRIVQVLVALAESDRLSQEESRSVLVMLTRMALDPDDGIFRSAIASSLAWFARRLQPRELASARNNVLELLRQLSRSEQFAAIRLLFSATCGNRWFVTSLCYALLIDAEDSGTSISVPDIPRIRDLLDRKTGQSPFIVSKTSSNADLYYSVQILQIMLSRISTELLQDANSTRPEVHNTAVAVRKEMKDLAASLENLDGRLRTDIRASDVMLNKAKNALARLAHSLTYQIRDAEERANRNKAHKLKSEGVQLQPNGQMSLTGFFKAKAKEPTTE